MRTLLVLFVSLIAACGGSSSTSAAAPAPQALDRDVRDLVSALTPPSATANSAVRSDWFNRRDKIMKRLTTAGPDMGDAALAYYQEHPEAILDVRRGVLEVAAKNQPEAVRPELLRLFTEYGEDLGLRTKACELLALTSPAEAIKAIEPVLSTREVGRTMPPDEIMVTSYAIASDLADNDPVPLFSALAADLFAEQTARLMAVKQLGKRTGARSRETLKIVLVESTGNAYLRRTAAQALVAQAKIDPDTQAELCGILDDVMNKEADLNFQAFLVNMIEKYCR